MSDEMLTGLTVHVLEPLTLRRTASEFSSSTFLARGDVIEVTETDIEQNKNRLGDSILSIADEPELQALRYGKVLLGVGPWPEGLPVYRTAYEDPATWDGKVHNTSVTLNSASARRGSFSATQGAA
jgi:hypothetical protein